MCSEEEVHLHKSFEGAVDIVSTKINKGMSNDDMKELYALFKQATEGDVNTMRPGMFDFRGTVKWEAWLGKKGTERGKAMRDYINLVKKLEKKYGLMI